MNKIGVFCSSSNRMEQVYYDEAARLGKWMGENGKTLVYGGANCGLMEAIAKAVKDAGGKVMGIVPQILVDHNRFSTYIDEMVLTQDLNDRKQGIIDNADIILALPGSVGTLDEVFTVLAANTIGIHQRKVIFWNINGFWDDLFVMLDGLERKNVVNKPFSEFLLTANSLEDVMALCR